MVVNVYARSLDKEWKDFLKVPTIAIQSVMACKVFRELKTGVLLDHANFSEQSTSNHLEFAAQAVKRSGATAVRHHFNSQNQSGSTASNIDDINVGGVRESKNIGHGDMSPV